MCREVEITASENGLCTSAFVVVVSAAAAAVVVVAIKGVPVTKIGTLSNRRRRPDDGNRKRDISFETSLRMYNTF